MMLRLANATHTKSSSRGLLCQPSRRHVDHSDHIVTGMKRAEDGRKVVPPHPRRRFTEQVSENDSSEGSETIFEYGGAKGGDEPENTLPSPCKDDLSLRGQGRVTALMSPPGTLRSEAAVSRSQRGRDQR